MKKTWAEKLGLTDAEYKELCDSIYRTWEYIASDLMACSEQDRMRRSEVIECTLDANHPTSCNPKMSPKLKKLLDNYNDTWYRILEKALKADVFKYEWYS